MTQKMSVLQLLFIAALVGVSQAQVCTKQANSDIASPDIGHQSWVSEDQCCGICDRYGGCKAYAWNAHDGGTCWLKSQTGPIVWAEGVSTGILFAGPGDGLVTFNEFSNAVVNSNGCPGPSQAQYDAFIRGLPKSQITTKQEAAMALTHYIHESDCLRARREYACEHTGCPGSYETPGCDRDGQDYYGRGYIQLTWCGNYNDASWSLYNDDRLVADPDSVARDENIAWEAAFWYWMARVHSQWGVADGMFGVTTRAINGPLECDGGFQHVARHRFEMYGRVRAAFGLGGAGDERGCYN